MQSPPNLKSDFHVSDHLVWANPSDFCIAGPGPRTPDTSCAFCLAQMFLPNTETRALCSKEPRNIRGESPHQLVLTWNDDDSGPPGVRQALIFSNKQFGKETAVYFQRQGTNTANLAVLLIGQRRTFSEPCNLTHVGGAIQSSNSRMCF